MQRFGSFEFDVGSRRLLSGGHDVHLTPKAFDLLSVLIEAAPEVVSKRDLFDRLWPRQEISDATLAGLVKELRRALKDKAGSDRIIRTVHRVGYAFDAALSAPVQDRLSNCILVVDGQRNVLLDGENFVGRDPACSVWIDKATVSRQHARIMVRDHDATLEDLGSKNGTRVGDESVEAPRELRDGDIIRFGEVETIFREGRSSLPTDTQASRVDFCD